ncbi:MAG: TerB family tellurite resistance protein [Lachnospiraceae bacterium]|nr:TerB family tellurite resistance protein [Lachnospiraceae bacterium]
MYLKDLMQGEKYAFYSIVKHFVSVDGEYSDDEKNLVNGFLDEMQLKEEQINEIAPDDAIDMLTFSTYSTRKKIFIELIGVSLCDEVLHIEEKNYLDKIATAFQISDEEKEELIKVVHELLGVYGRMNSLVGLPPK